MLKNTMSIQILFKIYLERMMTDEVMERYQQITDDFLGKEDEENKENKEEAV